ncbi:MAG: metallophosphoesterase [Desulfobacterales bacterium]|nr:metallophosphoesterase [Desulfobacterales bacterium]
MVRRNRIFLGLLAFFAVAFTTAPYSFSQDTTISSGFSVILVPDTQYYTKYYPQIYRQQTRWIADNRDRLNIKFVIHMGDITQDNTTRQWQVADKAHQILDQAGIPFSVVPGNHDMPSDGLGRKRDTSLFNRYFGPHRFAGKTWYGGHLGPGNENNYSFFDSGGLKFMVLGLEFAPTRAALAWANDIVRKFKDHRVIVVMHCYLAKSPAGDTGAGGYQKNCAERYHLDGSGGDTVWKNLIRRHQNIFMVLSGHVHDVEHKKRIGLSGNPIHEILTDYQSEHPGGDIEKPKSGNGWLRSLLFFPDENRIDVRPHSVIGEKGFYLISQYDPDPRHNDHAFSIEYRMKNRTP